MDKRSYAALAICVLIFIGWFWIQQRLWPPPPPGPPPKKPEVTNPQASKPAPPPPPTTTVAPAPAVEPSKYAEKPSFTLSSPELDVVLTNKGAGIEKIFLHYPKPQDSVAILDAYEAKHPHLAVRDVGGPDAIESLPWEIVSQAADKVGFRYRLRNNVEITKEFWLEPKRHTLLLTILLDNKNAPPEGKTEPPEQSVKLELLAFNSMHPDNPYRYEQYLAGVYGLDKDLKTKPLPEIEKGEGKMVEALRMPAGAPRDKEIKTIEDDYFKVDSGRKEWFGLRNRFFSVLVNPDGSALDVLDSYWWRESSPQATKAQGRRNIDASARTKEMHIGGSRKLISFTLYAGTMQPEMLAVEVPAAKELTKYSGGCWLAPIVKYAAAVILELLKFTHMILRNWGLGIIATTLLIRLCLFPLSLKSQRSALQMQQLQPKFQMLRERYKDDQQKYGIEQMRLMREHKVNPFSGCLPLFIQMPIFVGMYSVFEMSIELRGQPFFAWIHDLSQPDQLFGGHWGVEIPLLITTLQINALNLLPILMTITWFLQAYFTPRSPDPQMAQQQKMMMAMPIIFGLTCYGLASGLSLYFLVNSLLGMAEQRIIKKYILKIPPAQGAPAVSGTDKGK